MSQKIKEILGEKHPIWVEMNRLHKGYVPSEAQAYRMLKPDDPAKVASSLESYMLDLKEDAARYLAPAGVKPEDITNEEALSAIVEFGGWKGTSGQDADQARRLGSLSLVEIGKRLAPPQKGLIELCYEDILKRKLDKSGLRHYQDRLDTGGEGNSILDIIRDIYLSPEAEALRGENRG